MPRQLIIALCLLACVAGCGKHKWGKKKQKPEVTQPTASATMAPAAMGPAIPAQELAGTWNLKMPGGNTATATITAIDAANININGVGTLSGNYTIQGPHLLILTPNKKIYMLAWQVMSKDSLLLTRAPTPADVGADYTGATLTRGAPTTAR